MSTVEKVERFLKERKTPVNTKLIANHFLMSMSAIQRALKELENAGKAQRKRKANTHYWTRTPVAVPSETPKLHNPPAFNRPIQNSYPLIRGYED
jgi:predicted transcriptional regulator